MKKRICIAGHLCVDNVYACESFPREGELTNIISLNKTTGGLINNTSMSLARLDPNLSIVVSGCIGPDSEGDYLLSRLSAFPNIDLSQIRKKGGTGFTAVMTNEQTKSRTFFQYSGSNAIYSEADIDWDALDADVFHIGYILLLPALDAPDAEYGTKMARLLKHAQEHGLKTSVDIVSETGERFQKIVPPALKYVDYCIINEIEAQGSTGIPLRTADGKLLTENIPAALQKLHEMGVSEWAVIHAPEGGFGMDAAGSFVALPSLNFPEGYIKGTTGAGDAFCAGVLCAIENEKTLEEAIELGTCSAGASLSQADSNSGIRPADEVLKLRELYA